MRRHVFDPGSVYVGFVVDKMTLGQGFPEYFGLPQSISFHQCSITRKMTIIIIVIMRLRKKP
jgi:formylmethanofuran dehydrogenase subunit D